MLSTAWRNERPTKPGQVWVSVEPSRRKSDGFWFSIPVVSAEIVDGDRGGLFVAIGLAKVPLNDTRFDGAQWAKREIPLDPFAAPQPVTPRPGQVWQKLNVGTKTATSAPRITLNQIAGKTVFWDCPDRIRKMRITTLQRDWHCLNPEVS